MTSYDPKAIYRFATMLYRRAQVMVLAYTLAGALTGVSMGSVYSGYTELRTHPSIILPDVLRWGLGTPQPQPQPDPLPATSTLICALAGGLIGFLIGWNKTLTLKLQVQTILCQAKIEENTSTSPARA